MANELEDDVIEAARDLRAFLDGLSSRSDVVIFRRGRELATQTRELKALLNETERALKALDEEPSLTGSPAAPGRDESDSVPDSSEERLVEDGEASTLEAFFGTVARGVSDAQRELDRQSADYLREIAGEKHLIPAVYRLPKLKANIKFAMGKTDGKGLNLLFLNRRQERTQHQEQSIEFEIVSAPPAVEALQALDERSVQFRVLTVGAESGRVAEQVARWGESTEDPHDQGLINALKNSRSEVIVFRSSQTGDVYLFAAFRLTDDEAADNRHLGLWRLAIEGDAEDPVVSKLWRQHPKSNERLLTHVRPLFERQAELLDREAKLRDLLAESNVPG